MSGRGREVCACMSTCTHVHVRTHVREMVCNPDCVQYVCNCTCVLPRTSCTSDALLLLFLQVSKRWYDYDRMSLNFIKIAKELQHSPLVFKHHQDFDENGILYWIGSNARCTHTHTHTHTHMHAHTHTHTHTRAPAHTLSLSVCVCVCCVALQNV